MFPPGVTRVGWSCLTTCASAASDKPHARTITTFHTRHRHSPPARSPFRHACRLHARVGPPRGITHDELPRPAPLQVQQSAHRKDGGEEPGYTEREEYPNEEERVGSGESVGNACCPL